MKNEVLKSNSAMQIMSYEDAKAYLDICGFSDFKYKVVEGVDTDITASTVTVNKFINFLSTLKSDKTYNNDKYHYYFMFNVDNAFCHNLATQGVLKNLGITLIPYYKESINSSNTEVKVEADLFSNDNPLFTEDNAFNNDDSNMKLENYSDINKDITQSLSKTAEPTDYAQEIQKPSKSFTDFSIPTFGSSEGVDFNNSLDNDQSSDECFVITPEFLEKNRKRMLINSILKFDSFRSVLNGLENDYKLGDNSILLKKLLSKKLLSNINEEESMLMSLYSRISTSTNSKSSAYYTSLFNLVDDSRKDAKYITQHTLDIYGSICKDIPSTAFGITSLADYVIPKLVRGSKFACYLGQSVQDELIGILSQWLKQSNECYEIMSSAFYSLTRDGSDMEYNSLNILKSSDDILNILNNDDIIHLQKAYMRYLDAYTQFIDSLDDFFARNFSVAYNKYKVKYKSRIKEVLEHFDYESDYESSYYKSLYRFSLYPETFYKVNCSKAFLKLFLLSVDNSYLA